MFENIFKFFKKAQKEKELPTNSKSAAKERLHLVLMQDRANVSADFLDLMKQEIIDVIKKYIEVDESAIDVRLTNKENEDGTNGAPALYANIPIVNIKNEARKIDVKADKTVEKVEIIKNENEAEKDDENKVEEKEEKIVDEKENKKEEILEIKEENDNEEKKDDIIENEEEKEHENEDEKKKGKVKENISPKKNTGSKSKEKSKKIVIK